MSVFQFILASLACYRVSVLLARDAGPWGVCKKLRKMAHLGGMIGCHFCNSIWIAVGIEVGFYFSGVRDSFVVSACIVMAMSAITICLDRVFTSDHVT